MTTTRISDLRTDGLTRDQIIITLVQEGMTLNAATNAYTKYAREQGLTPSIVSHKAAAMAWLEANFDVDSWDAAAVRGAVVDLQAEFNVVESTARDYAKAFSESLDVTHPIENPREAIFAWVAEHIQHMGREELRKGLIAFACDELGRSRSNANEYVKGLDLHFAIVDSQA